MKMREAKEIVSALGFTLRKNEWNEYVLRLRVGATEENTYYTDDLDDAIGTAQQEAKRRSATGE